MFRRFSINYALFSMALDALLVSLSFFLAVQIRPNLSELSIFAFLEELPPVPIALYFLFSVGWVAALMLVSIYDGRRNLRITEEMTTLTIGSILAGVSLAGMLYFSYRGISRALFLTFGLLTYTFLASWRLLARIIFHKLKDKLMSYRRVLIVGAGPVGRQLQITIQENGFLGLTLVGFLDDNPEKEEIPGEILGCVDTVRNAVIANQINDVVIALPLRAYEKVNNLVAELHTLPVKVWLVPDYFHLALHKAVGSEFAEIPMLDLRAPALDDYQRLIKRAFDLVVGSLLMIPAAPLMALIAFAIRLDSRGPALFRQLRVGENGRLFWIYKFRTMVDGADKRLHEVMKFDGRGNLVHKNPQDPRVTRIGRILRRTSLDELPQFFNVFKGEMSLVGPRPELPSLVEQYEPWQYKRLVVPQGMTGWWQVNGRSEKPLHLHTEDDIFYVQNYSLLLDIMILIKTAWVVLRGKGAF